MKTSHTRVHEAELQGKVTITMNEFYVQHPSNKIDLWEIPDHSLLSGRIKKKKKKEKENLEYCGAAIL